MPNSVRFHRVLRAAPETVYRAFLDPDAMAKWLPPNGFTGRVHEMNATVGGTYRMSFTNFAFTPDGKTLFVTDSGKLLAFDTATGNPVAEYNAPEKETLWQIATSPDGTFVAAGGREKVVLWRTGNPFQTRTAEAGSGHVQSLAFGGTKHLAAGISMAGQQVHVFEINRAELEETAEGTPDDD